MPFLVLGYFADVFDYYSRLIRELFNVVNIRNAGKHKHGVGPGFYTGYNVGIHTVADYRDILYLAAEKLYSGAHHKRIGFAEKICGLSG